MVLAVLLICLNDFSMEFHVIAVQAVLCKMDFVIFLIKITIDLLYILYPTAGNKWDSYTPMQSKILQIFSTTDT